MLAGIILILIGAITMVSGGVKGAISSETVNGQTVHAESRMAVTRGILTGVCLLGGTWLVIASVFKN